MRRHAAAVLLALTFALPPAAQAGAYDEILVAARENRTEVVADLIRRGMDPNTSDRTGTTLLMTAAGNGNDELIDFLIRHRANIGKRNAYGDTAVAIAALHGHLSTVRRLVEAGADVAGGRKSWGALHYAAFAGNVEIVRYLAGRGAALDAPAPNGQTALMLAAKNSHLEAVRALVDADADLDLEDPEGRSALDIALKAGHTDIADYLRQEGAEE